MPKISLNLPDFIIVGANKAGTTSLTMYLRQHPSINMASVKEPMFFSSDPYKESAPKSGATLGKPYYATTIDEYSSLFENCSSSGHLFGESSTAYLANPFYSSKLIYKITPKVKLIAILREPVSRAISAYKMCYGNGIEKRSFSEIVKNAKQQNTILKAHGVKEYIRNGLYSQLLQPYLDLFEKKNILLLKYDEFKAYPKKIMDRILNFLEVSKFNFDTSRFYNVARDHGATHPPIETQDVMKLQEFFRSDILAAQKLTGLNFEDWLEPIRIY